MLQVVTVQQIVPASKSMREHIQERDHTSNSQNNHIYHMILSHDHNMFCLYCRCQMCSYSSKNSSQLTVHLRTHTGDTPFKCHICLTKFKIGSDLTRHMRIHSGEKPFKCDHCDYFCAVKG